MTTRETVTPDSSHTSLRTASSIDSAGSIKPANAEYQFGGKRLERPSRIRLLSAERTTAMMVGSVRGKDRFEIVVRVLQGGRSAGFPSAIRAASVGGHARFVPPFTGSVVHPHVPQKVLRLFQSMRARDCAKIAAEKDRNQPSFRLRKKTRWDTCAPWSAGSDIIILA